MEQLPVRSRRYLDPSDAELEAQPRAVPAGYFEVPGEDAGEDWNRWLGYLSTLKRHKVTLAIATLAGPPPGLGYNVAPTPMFRASSTLEFQSPGSQQQPFEGISYLNSNDPYLLQTQVQLLTSNMLQARVQAKLRDAIERSQQDRPPGRDGLGILIGWTPSTLAG